MLSKMKLAMIQIKTGLEKVKNLKKVEGMIETAARNGANLVILPESFASPYGNEYFKDYAESIPGPASLALAEAAQKHKINIIGGSIIEKDASKIYNTCTVYDQTGSIVSKFRKLHLFDIDVPGKIVFKESETLSAGDKFATVTLDGWKIGLGICYDVRFAELARIYSDLGCDLLVYPGAFNMTTGPAHWQLLARARAVDNQVYVAMCSIAHDNTATYNAWGHSILVDPWGTPICHAGGEEDILYADLSLERLNEVRNQIPILKQRRTDLYTVGEMKNIETIVIKDDD